MDAKMRDSEVRFNTDDGFGTAIISESAIKKIAAIALNDIQGVSLLNENKNIAKIQELISKNHQTTKGIHIKIDGNDLRVSINVMVEYGVEIPVLIQTVQEKIKASIENMTGLNVISVNVRVPEVKIEQE